MGVLAHGIGGRQDLPISLSFLLAGAALAVLVSFAVLGLTWQSSRFRGDRGRPVPQLLQTLADHPVTRGILRAVGLLATLLTLYVAAAGPLGAANPAPWTIFIVFWVGLVAASLLLGPVWKLLNPLRTLHQGIALLSGGKPLAVLPARVGYWPAAVGLFAFTWLELVAPERTTGTVMILWFASYSAVMIIASTVFGAAWFDKGDAFEAYSALIGRMAPLGRRDGRLVLRNPFDGLAGLPAAPGLVAMVSVMLGSTAYDGFSRSPWWVDKLQSGPLPMTLTGSLGLLALVLLVALTYWATTRNVGPTALAHSLIPIAVGYLVAHYFSLLVFGSQQAVILWSDPLGDGSDLLGTRTLTVNYSMLSATTLAVIRAGAVVVGHVMGVFAAHDRAVDLLPRRRALTGQLPLLLLMVFYTVGGLLLMFAA
ncbi:MAG: hypothetical protein ABIS86_15865 [Streptosporangiaceae bacterium]